MPADERDKPLPPGTVLEGKYRIIGPIGEGGMGMVYHAKHLLMRKDVALKRLHPTLSAVGQVVQRFEREAQAAARIDHPNVCMVTDCGNDEAGGFFIVMELLQGLSLQEVLDAQGYLPFDRIIHLGKQICSALEQAHSLGIVHRDLKPDNIMLVEKDDDTDFVKIMDFGIAKMVTDDSTGLNLTQAGMVFGTPHYLSPEQASGDPIDNRSDLYSLGVILFEMATGRRPFDAPNAAALIRMHVTTAPPAIEEVVPGRRFPVGFQQIISRLLAKEPADRYPSAKVVRDQLVALEEMEGITTELPSPTSMAADTTRAPTYERPPPLPDEGDISVEVSIESFNSQSMPSIDDSAEERMKRLWQSSGAARWAILSGTVLVAAAVVGAIFFFVLRKENVEDDTEAEVEEARVLLLEQQRSEFNETPEIKEALTLSIEGRTDEAIAALEKLASRPEYAESPHIHYHLAVLHSNEADLGAATAEVARCLELEPGYATEPILLGILIEAFRDPDTTKVAVRVMKQFPSEELAGRLEPIAREDQDRRLRGQALTVLREGHMIEHLEPWSRYAAELADPDPNVPCETRRELLGKLAETGDARALPALALFRSTTGCGGEDCWACLRAEWQKAVDVLQAGSAE